MACPCCISVFVDRSQTDRQTALASFSATTLTTHSHRHDTTHAARVIHSFGQSVSQVVSSSRKREGKVTRMGQVIHPVSPRSAVQCSLAGWLFLQD
mmetsp:Transcript_45734/g.113650  ORF Transcript_45734/g.113650 Transcript_45734/m.113650 type:complete len:96 (-) Transcript_45734:407-694(-)